jgi:hypothetical protein
VYNATLANHSRILDHMDFIDRIECFETKVVLHLSLGYDGSTVARNFQGNIVVHGGSEWGCTNTEMSKAIPFYYQVNKSIVTANGEISLHGSPCSPFALFKALNWALWSEDPQPPSESAARRLLGNSDAEDSGSESMRVSDRFEQTYQPSPIQVQEDLLKILGVSELGSVFASARYSYSPLIFYWSIDTETDGPASPTINSNTMWMNLTQSFELDLSVKFQAAWSHSNAFSLLPRTPIPGMSIAFNIGGVGFELGLSAQVNGKLDAEFDAGPLVLSTGLTATRDDKVGFSYDGADFAAIDQQGQIRITPHNSGHLPSELSGSLKLSVMPLLELDLQGCFLTERQSFALKVDLSSPRCRRGKGLPAPLSNASEARVSVAQ